MSFNELNSVEHYIIHQLSGVYKLQLANRAYLISQFAINFCKNFFNTGLLCNIANRDTQYK